MTNRGSVAVSWSRCVADGHAVGGFGRIVAVVASHSGISADDLVGERGGAAAVADDADLPEPALLVLAFAQRSGRPGCRRRARPWSPSRSAG